MIMNKTSLISKLFLERSNFVLIGLTGRTGSGCTTAATILESENPDFPSPEYVRHRGQPFYNGLDRRRYGILKEYSIKNWNKFYSIKVSDLISAYILRMSAEDAADFIVKHGKIEPDRHAEVLEMLTEGVFSNNYITRKFSRPLEVMTNHDFELESMGSLDKFRICLKLVRKFTYDFKDELKKINNNLYIALYQAAGDSIRTTGKVTIDYTTAPFDPQSVSHLPETINRVVKILRKKNKGRAFIVIDAIRNPYEARYFKERYSAFYLMSINAPDEDRTSYLQNIHKFNVDQLDALEKKESGELQKEEKKNNEGKEFTIQNVKRCIEMSDIHIFNPRNELDNNNVLKAQLGWYVALMMHPGLVTPTSMERVMQIAYTAKTNSGCISRQVGAAITDDENSVKAIGWNDVARGQVPCGLRSLGSLNSSFDTITFSSYERTNKQFRDAAKAEMNAYEANQRDLKGRNLSYCFKDLKNSLDSKSNQVHTRSLHAEENAFLQLSKYGGPGIRGGKLYTTASPCELCAKKAYQLGVSEIIFIDPYPGIARENILSIGTNPPELTQFRGAVGKGYHQLYEQTLSYKDELSYFRT
jgi:deoxycytidylate deaminase